MAQFKSQQLKYSRVKAANNIKADEIQVLFTENGIQLNNLNIYLIAYKQEGRLELWAKNKGDSSYKFMKHYPICASSGKLGPKRKQGDRQVPEGCYHIDRFNPVSNYHLSLGLNYPNKSDRILKNGNKAGGDIFIHGNCVTIGCLPITDELIKELYLICVEAKNNGQEIPVTIYPTILNDLNYNHLIKEYERDTDKIKLWKALKEAHELFIKTKSIPQFIIDDQGTYQFKP